MSADASYRTIGVSVAWGVLEMKVLPAEAYQTAYQLGSEVKVKEKWMAWLA